MTVDPNGRVWLNEYRYGAPLGFLRTPLSIAPCVDCCPPGAPSPSPQPFCASDLRILPATTRWRPQRGTQPVKVHIAGPPDLQSATLGVTLPDATPAVVDPQPPLEPTSTIPPYTYKLAWSGPWTRPNPTTGALEPRPHGHYTVKVSALSAGSASPLESNPYDRISLVEVVSLDFEALPGAPALDDNPAVPVLPGQDPGLARPGGGQRMFSEATSANGPAYNRVKVVAVISPPLSPDASLPPEATTVRVHFKSFDVDDPAPSLPDLDGDVTVAAVADNRGTPGNGVLEAVFLDVPAGQTRASTALEVSQQPGDNYRVAASTSHDWIDTLHARQVVAPEEPVQDGRLNVSGPNVSPMLTVWRTLRLEIDSMAAPPVEDTPASDPRYAARNFIKGRLVRVSPSGPTLEPPGATAVIEPRYIYVEPEATTPALGLGDGSQELPLHNGRFEQGRLRLGEGEQAVMVEPLDGNGTDPASGLEYVRAITTPPEPPRIEIPFELIQGTLRRVMGRVLAWDSATRVFTLERTVMPAYVGGTLNVAGLSWTVAAVAGDAVTVVEDQNWPFVLVDDDPHETAFPVSSVYLQDSDDPAKNVSDYEDDAFERLKRTLFPGR